MKWLVFVTNLTLEIVLFVWQIFFPSLNIYFGKEAKQSANRTAQDNLKHLKQNLKQYFGYLKYGTVQYNTVL